MKRSMLIAALLALPCMAAAAETIRWPVPWSAMPTLVYETERLDREDKAGTHEATRSADITEISVSQAREDGFRQRWRSEGATFEVLEGDKTMEAPMRDAMQAFAGMPLEVELDAAGQYTRLHDVEALAARFREAMGPVVHAGIDAQLATLDAPVQEKARTEALAQVDAMLDRMAAPAMVEAMLSRVLQTYNGFVGVDLEPGQWYELETELPNPLGGPAFPAKLQVMLTPSNDEADDVWLEWNQRIDPVKGAAAIWALAEKLVGQEIPAEARKDLPKEVDFHDEGVFLFRRSTGVIEMFETVRTVKLADTAKVERQRMRLTSGDHVHEWVPDDAGDAEDRAGAENTGTTAAP
jgi:hypothetical protein